MKSAPPAPVAGAAVVETCATARRGAMLMGWVWTF
jgi:hypothetical protein